MHNKKKNLPFILCLSTVFAICAFFMASSYQTKAATLAKPVIQTVNRKGTKKATITWKKISGAQGYQIQYADNIEYKNAKLINISGGSTVTKSTGLFPTTKDTCLRLRAYKVSDGKKVYSAWSTNVKIIVWKSSWKYAKNSKIHTDVAVLYATRNANKKYKTVAINAGHGCTGGSSQKTLCHPDGSPKVTGGSTSSGATYATAINEGTNVKGMSEAAANLKIALKLKDKLLANGYNVLMLRQDSNTQLDNIARTVMANNNAHCHIAIHFDDTTSNKGAFYMSVPNISRYRNMEPVKSHWKQHHALGNQLISGFKRGGLKIFSTGSMGMDLTQTSYSTIASVDIEVGDRGTSTSDSSLNKIATCLYSGLVYYFK